MNSKVVKEQFVESEEIMKNYYYNIEKGINVRKYLMTNIAGIKINANINEIKQFNNESYVVMRHNFGCEIGEKVNTFLNEYKAKLLWKLKHLIEKMLMQSVSL